MKKYLSVLLISIFLNQIIFSQKDSSKIPDWSITKQSIKVNGKTLNYTATAGYMLLKDESGKSKAKINFISYVMDGVSDQSNRPVTFTYNGGPGSASVWLHMGVVGPKRVLMSDKGDPLSPPYTIVDNDYTWLDLTDLVFIDPVETGYSRPADGVDKKEFLGFNEDISSVGEFIRLYTTQFQRWDSPKFLAGESYGTTRSAGLSGFLQDKYGMYINGIMLISSILNFQTARFEKGNDLPHILFLPTYSAIAWYHKKLDPTFTNLNSLLKEVEDFAMNEYSTLLMKGDKLTDAEKNNLAKKLSRYTGLSEAYCHSTLYRIDISRFVKELRRTDGLTVGRLDGRFTGKDYDDAGERNEFDPSLNYAISGPFSTTINYYLREHLGVKNDLTYEILTSRVQPWSYANVQNQYLNVAETMRQAMHKNPFLKVHIYNGYYDLATPYFATDYTINHMMIDKDLRKNITQSFYESGHMMYIHLASMKKMKDETVKFIQSALK
ncbi:MAG: peptidase S10 [Bacteroidetes bacterium]|nr:peptidase S10 [Bacteroidota bacterium]